MKKRELLITFVLVLAITAALRVVWKDKIFERLSELVKETPLITSLTEIDQYYGKKIRVRGKTTPLFSKIDFINLANGDRLALCCGFKTDLHQQWVEITGVLEPPMTLDPNLPVAVQYTEAMLSIKQIKKIQLQDEKSCCESDSDCVVAAKPEERNACCLSCTEEAINKVTEKERKEWWAINCRDTQCPIYDCYQEKLATPKCVDNQCEIEWVNRETVR